MNSSIRTLKFEKKFGTLIKNDVLLKKIYNEHIQSRNYNPIINKYFSSIDISDEDIEKDEYDRIRVKNVTNSLKELWVKRHEKQVTFLIFEDFEKMENMLFMIPSYRGHYIHQFNVFLLGYFILTELIKNRCIKQNINNISQFTDFTWMLSSTFHDMGYPIQEIEDLFQKYIDMFLKIQTPFSVNIETILTQNFYDYIRYLAEIHYQMFTLNQNQWFIERERKRDYKFYDLILTKLREKDHGVIGALLLMHSVLTKENLVNRLGWLDRDFAKSILPACHAISLHNLKDINISFENQPYAFLLVLCDELQDWGRSKENNNKSELLDIKIENITQNPLITFKLQIYDDEKLNNLQELEFRLKVKSFTINIIAIQDDHECLFNITCETDEHN